MHRAVLPYGFFLALAAILSAAIPGHAQTVSVTTVVTVLGPKFTPPPAISKDDLTVYEGKQKRDINSWVPAQGDKAALELAIVIDDADSSDLGIQFNDITSFVKSLPKTTGVAIFYASNGTVQAASQFNTDHDAVVKALRMPFGRGAATVLTAFAAIRSARMSLPRSKRRKRPESLSTPSSPAVWAASVAISIA